MDNSTSVLLPSFGNDDQPSSLCTMPTEHPITTPHLPPGGLALPSRFSLPNLPSQITTFEAAPVSGPRSLSSPNLPRSSQEVTAPLPAPSSISPNLRVRQSSSSNSSNASRRGRAPVNLAAHYHRTSYIPASRPSGIAASIRQRSSSLGALPASSPLASPQYTSGAVSQASPSRRVSRRLSRPDLELHFDEQAAAAPGHQENEFQPPTYLQDLLPLLPPPPPPDIPPSYLTRFLNTGWLEPAQYFSPALVVPHLDDIPGPQHNLVLARHHARRRSWSESAVGSSRLRVMNPDEDGGESSGGGGGDGGDDGSGAVGGDEDDSDVEDEKVVEGQIDGPSSSRSAVELDRPSPSPASLSSIETVPEPPPQESSFVAKLKKSKSLGVLSSFLKGKTFTRSTPNMGSFAFPDGPYNSLLASGVPTIVVQGASDDSLVTMPVPVPIHPGLTDPEFSPIERLHSRPSTPAPSSPQAASIPSGPRVSRFIETGLPPTKKKTGAKQELGRACKSFGRRAVSCFCCCHKSSTNDEEEDSASGNQPINNNHHHHHNSPEPPTNHPAVRQQTNFRPANNFEMTDRSNPNDKPVSRPPPHIQSALSSSSRDSSPSAPPPVIQGRGTYIDPPALRESSKDDLPLPRRPEATSKKSLPEPVKKIVAKWEGMGVDKGKKAAGVEKNVKAEPVKKEEKKSDGFVKKQLDRMTSFRHGTVKTQKGVVTAANIDEFLKSGSPGPSGETLVAAGQSAQVVGRVENEAVPVKERKRTISFAPEPVRASTFPTTVPRERSFSSVEPGRPVSASFHSRDYSSSSDDSTETIKASGQKNVAAPDSSKDALDTHKQVVSSAAKSALPTQTSRTSLLDEFPPHLLSSPAPEQPINALSPSLAVTPTTTEEALEDDAATKALKKPKDTKPRRPIFTSISPDPLATLAADIAAGKIALFVDQVVEPVESETEPHFFYPCSDLDIVDYQEDSFDSFDHHEPQVLASRPSSTAYTNTHSSAHASITIGSPCSAMFDLVDMDAIAKKVVCSCCGGAPSRKAKCVTGMYFVTSKKTRDFVVNTRQSSVDSFKAGSPVTELDRVMGLGKDVVSVKKGETEGILMGLSNGFERCGVEGCVYWRCGDCQVDEECLKVLCSKRGHFRASLTGMFGGLDELDDEERKEEAFFRGQ
ncbi:hypothetical protein BJ508DRAFT_20338 [Ascobolus immersus RN42]|uniref:Uncharacterized protein n=1 Tax=Ascobolus immersus RN42 TaxID=1160509 RepID=A0A3N4ILC9_ASCIM|nr:hypothetical protein BJ508DRAFT_20338 [Ascobolus immersus RN42]